MAAEAQDTNWASIRVIKPASLGGITIISCSGFYSRFRDLMVIMFCLFLYCQPTQCNNPSQLFFTGYSISEGLSQSVVVCMYQDSRGYIWLGTQNGLNRFDGSSFKIYTYHPDDAGSISNNWIYSITEDNYGNLWIGTKGGLNRYIRKENRFERIRYSTPFQNDVTQFVYDVKTARNGNILINTPPVLTIINPGEMTFEHYLSPLEYDGSVKDYKIPLLEDESGSIWMGSTRGLACYLPDTKSFLVFCRDSIHDTGIYDDNITALWQDKQADILVGTSSGLNRISRSDNGMQPFTVNNPDELNAIHGYIRAFTGDRNGNIWIATEGDGLYQLGVDGTGNFKVRSYTTTNSGLFHNITLSLLIDRSENLWIGTLSGVNKADLKKQKFRIYRKSDSPNSIDLAGNVIASLYKDKNNLIWVGNWGQGLNIFDRNSGSVEHFSSQLTGRHYIPNDYVHTIYEDQEQNIWIGTRDGLIVYDETLRRFVRPQNYRQNTGMPDLAGLRIFRMIQGLNGDYWIATQDGLFRKQAGSSKPERFHTDAPENRRISGNLVYSIVEDKEGLIWIATLAGLDVFNPEIQQMKHFRRREGDSNTLADNYVIALCEDYKGDIWIGTASYVNKYSKKDNTFIHYSQAEGLTGNIIYNIIEDKNHNLWFATGNGLYRFNPSSGSFHTFNVDEGLQSQEFNLNAAYLSEDGELFLGGMNGFNSFYPDSLTINPYVPDVLISAFYKTVKGKMEYLNPVDDNTITLKHNEHSFTIEFAALEFTNPSRNKYMYKIEGVDDSWIEIGNRNFIALSNLSPGRYKFRIKGSNNDDVWSTDEAVLNVLIRPPWWRSNLAYTVYFLSAALMILWVFRRREHKFLKDRKILEDKVRDRTSLIEEQKSEILKKNDELNELNSAKDKFFSIIAHDLRNPFNYITGITEMMIRDLEQENLTHPERSLRNIKDSSQQAHELLENLLLWARSHTGTIVFNPAPVDMKELISESINQISSQANRKNINIHFYDADSVVFSVDVNMISTILRNLLINALKFTHPGGDIWIRLWVENSSCTISIRDNGVGIAEDKLAKLFSIGTVHKAKGTNQEPGTGLGLILCRELVERHDGKIEVVSKKDKGSEFRVVLPM
jgi:signal transduction histidine kinase/ligand-binding sensor domain-containing protein